MEKPELEFLARTERHASRKSIQTFGILFMLCGGFWLVIIIVVLILKKIM